MYLPHTYRFQALNESTVAIPQNKTFVEARRVKADTDATPIWEGAQASYILNSVDTHDNDEYEESATIDNSLGAAEWMRGWVQIVVDLTGEVGSPGGPVTFWVQASTDGGTTWPIDGKGFRLGSIDVQANQLYRVNALLG